LFPEDGMLFHDGRVPFHSMCYAHAPQAVLEWWLEQFMEAIHTFTTNTSDSPLHCYLSSTSILIGSAMEDNSHYLSAVKYLVAQQPSALHHSSQMGFLQLHMAAIHDMHPFGYSVLFDTKEFDVI